MLQIKLSKSYSKFSRQEKLGTEDRLQALFYAHLHMRTAFYTLGMGMGMEMGMGMF